MNKSLYVLLKTRKLMKKILSLKFCGTVEYVNTDRNGAHIRLSAYKKYDLINDVSIDVKHKICADIGYWNGYDYDSKAARTIRNLKAGDNIAVFIERNKGFFGNVEEKIRVENYTIEGYENLSEVQDLSDFKNPQSAIH